jgi:hypothetical protein
MKVKILIMKKAASEKQLAANRKNAQRSTGPRTATGKAASRLNAIKHGLLARQVVAAGFFHRESCEEFQKLSQEYYESLQPVGPVEEMFVGQIITVVWRLRRVRMAETGEVAVSVENTWRNSRLSPWEIGNGYKRNPLHRDFEDYLETVEGIEFLIECIQKLRAAIVTAGRFSWNMLEHYQKDTEPPNEIIGKLVISHKWLESNPESLPEHKLHARHRKDVLDFLDKQIKRFGGIAENRQTQMDSEDNIRRAAAMLPAQEVIDKIVRYESALQRQLYRSMNQLERLQRRRLGENVPAPVVMDVSVRS